MKTPPPLGAAMKARLVKAARAAAQAAYSPYSNFPVGSAVMAGSGRIYAAANVENASYGLSLCAERGAIVAAVSAGERSLTAVAVYTPTPSPTAPCGACRQVLNEFGPSAAVLCVCDSSQRLETTLSALLGDAFGPRNLLKAGVQPALRKAR